MKTYEQLSPAQKKVIQLMKEDQDSYCLKSNLYDFQQIVRPNIKDDLYKIEYCKRPTLRLLIKSEILIRKENKDRIMDKYILNPKFLISKKMYFENEDANTCYPLSYHIENAKADDLKEIELFEAIPDTLNKDIVWCTELENTSEKSECNKNCPYYIASKGRICDLRGKLMDWGEKVKFNVETSLPFLQ